MLLHESFAKMKAKAKANRPERKCGSFPPVAMHRQRKFNDKPAGDRANRRNSPANRKTELK
jgi:hypothetical protein